MTDTVLAEARSCLYWAGQTLSEEPAKNGPI